MFWNSRRVFLTGHTGFKGAWLSLWLEQLGAAVTGFSLAPPMHPSLFAEAEIASGITSILGDIRSLAGLRETMRHAEPEILIHMAAQSLVRPSYADPAATYSTNVLGTVNVLEAARVCPSICAIVVVSSDHGALDPYATSKACVELITDSYRASFFKRELFAEHRVAIAVARCGNLIGGGDWAPGRLLPDAVRAISVGAPLRVRNPHATSPWQHVLEPLSGYLRLAQALVEDGIEKDGAWNFGPEPASVQSVESVVRAFTKRWNSKTRNKAHWSAEPGPHPGESHMPPLDCSRANNELSWWPTLSFADSVTMTADWYARRKAGENPRALCLQQIARYSDCSMREPELFAQPELKHIVQRAPGPPAAGSLRA